MSQSTPLPIGDFANVHNPARAADLRACGIDTDCVPIRSIIPFYVELPIGERLAYLLDVTRLTPAQVTALADHIAARFDQPREGLEETLRAEGVPILSDEVTAFSTAPWKYLD